MALKDKEGIIEEPECEKCGKALTQKRLKIIKGPCYNCRDQMKIAVIETIFDSCYYKPSEFTNEEINLAIANGVVLKIQESKTASKSYFANTCPTCGAFAGEFYLFTDYVAPANNGNLDYDLIEIGYFCEDCEDNISDD